MTCSVDGCGKPDASRQLCRSHYRRFLRHGDPLIKVRPDRGELLRYFTDVVLAYESDECLLWPYGKSRDGYARMRYEGKARYVSQLLCETIYGPAPTDDHESAHSCGNSGCCNKRHVRWATSTENKNDMLEHGTRCVGSRHGRSRLSEERARAILELAGTAPQRVIALKFGVSEGTVQYIQSRKTWKHLDKRDDRRSA